MYALYFSVEDQLKEFSIRPSGEHNKEVIVNLIYGIKSYEDFTKSMRKSGICPKV